MGDPKEKKPVALVFGATGAQGGTVVRSLLDSGKYILRGATRDPESVKAKELSSKGVEIVKVDQEKTEEVRAAFQGVYAAYVVTNPSFNPTHRPTEYEVGAEHARLAKEAGVQHYIWSTLPDVSKISDGKYNFSHFTDKAKVDEVVKAQGFKYTTFVQANWYYDNIDKFYTTVTLPDGSVRFNMPYSLETVHAGFDVDDIGPAVRTALENPNEWNGKYINFEGYKAPMRDWLATYEKVTGKKTSLAGESFQGPPPVKQMYQFFDEFGLFNGQDATTGQKASPTPLTSWADWLKLKSGHAKP